MGQLRALVTGSCGLIGSEACLRFYEAGYAVIGIDNNQRAVFLGPAGESSGMFQRLPHDNPAYEHHSIDIRDREAILRLFEDTMPAVIIHAAAQPSHDRAAQIPFDDLIPMRLVNLTYFKPLVAGRAIPFHSHVLEQGLRR